MKIVCAETVLLGKEAFQTAGDTVVLPDRTIARDDLIDADALVVRSKTKVNAELLKGTPVQFVGTATAGFDHIDVNYLESRGIGWCASPGCNANSVSEYLVAALLTLCNRHGFRLEKRTIGVIGCGNVGSHVVEKCSALGMHVLRNDPPLAAVSIDPDFQTLETVLAESDIVTLHVPLVQEKPWPTFQMANHHFFSHLKPGAIFINASRGKVTDSDALIYAKNNYVVSHAVIDVWDPEPAFRIDMLEAADIATAHIAGHSYEGKLNGTVNVYNELCHFFEIEKRWDVATSLPEPEVPVITIDCTGLDDESVLYRIVKRVYDIELDDANLRAAAVKSEAARARNFDALRANYRIRREFMNTTVHLLNGSEKLKAKLSGLGFKIG